MKLVGDQFDVVTQEEALLVVIVLISSFKYGQL